MEYCHLPFRSGHSSAHFPSSLHGRHHLSRLYTRGLGGPFSSYNTSVNKPRLVVEYNSNTAADLRSPSLPGSCVYTLGPSQHPLLYYNQNENLAWWDQGGPRRSQFTGKCRPSEGQRLFPQHPTFSHPATTITILRNYFVTLRRLQHILRFRRPCET